MIELEIQDCQGRYVLRQNDKGRVLLGRYVDLDEDIQSFAIHTFCELTGYKEDRVSKFMNFENDENAFCS